MYEPVEVDLTPPSVDRSDVKGSSKTTIVKHGNNL